MSNSACYGKTSMNKQIHYPHPGRPPLNRPKDSKKRLLIVHLTDEEWNRLQDIATTNARERGLDILEFYLNRIKEAIE